MKNTKAFTLIELMVVIAIIGIMSGIVVPNLIAWSASHRLNGSAREFQAFINGARLEAIKNNATVNVAIDTTNQKITSRYINRVDVTLPPVIKEVLLRPGVTIDSETFTEDADGFAFSINSRGLPTNSGTITLIKSDGEIRQVIIGINGDARIAV